MLEELLALRAESEFLASLSEAELEDLHAELEEVACRAGETLLRAGEAAGRVYLLLAGRMQVLLVGNGEEPLVVAELGPGDVFGEVALFLGGERTATVRALSDCRLAGLSREGFGALVRARPDTSKHLAGLVLGRLRRSRLAPQLCRIFGQLELATLRDLERRAEWLALKSGRTLFRQGDAADAAFLVISGRLRAVLETPEGGEQVLGEVGPGETVGEVALLTGGRRTATVYAVRDADLVRLSRRLVDELIEKHPRAMVQISRILVERHLRRKGGDPAHTVALVAAHPGVPLADVGERLARSLARLGSVALLTSAGVDDALARIGAAQISASEAQHLRLVQWLHQREAASRFVVYRADPGWTPWTDRCVRHADHLLIVADAASPPAPGETEERLAGRWPPARAPRRSLVLLRRGPGAGTAAWLAGREIDGHFHVDPDSDADFDRLARCLTGAAVGLVLGGGGARGFAHIGVLRAFEELEIPIDWIGGTSMGAIVAGLAAMGLSPAQIRERCARHAGAQLDFTFPATSLLAGRKIGAQLRALFGDRRIEDLALPYFAVSTNLTRAEEVVHARGRLRDAIRASVSMPGILPPVQKDGDLLVDGGLINNVPVDVMRERSGGGPVIAVDVSQAVDLVGDPRFTPEHSGWQWLRRRLNPFRETRPVPGILAVLQRTTVVGSLARLERTRSQADLYLDLGLGEWRLLEFEALEAIAERGYEQAIGPLREWVSRA